MKHKLLGALAALLLSATSAHASVIYSFDFSNLQGVTGGSGADFNVTLTAADFVTVTGMAPLAGPPLPTTLGYSVSFTGTNNLGFWGFDDDNSSILNDGGFTFNGQSFLYAPLVTPGTGYFTTAGSFAGRISGNAPNSFSGDALLTITQVHEPAPLALLALGLLALGLGKRGVA